MINDVAIVSIGSNCASEGLIETANKENDLGLEFKTGFFDFTIVSPKSIIQFFNYYKAGNVIDVLSNKDNYERVLLADGRSSFRHLIFDCLYLWHETATELPSNFSEKTVHKLNSLFNYPGQIYFRLNNSMEQARDNLELANDDPNKLNISYDDFIELKILAKELFNAEVLLKTFPNFCTGFPNEENFYELTLHQIKTIFKLTN